MLKLWALFWEDERKSMNFRLYWNKLDLDYYLAQHKEIRKETVKILEVDINGMPDLWICYDKISDPYGHSIHLTKRDAEKWLQEHDSGKLDVARIKPGTKF